MPKRRKKVVVKEVSLVDSPAIRKKFVFYKNNKKEVNSMIDKELEFLKSDDTEKKDDQKEKELAADNLEITNLVKGSINSVSKLLHSMAKSAGYTFSPKFKEIGTEEILESDVASDASSIEEVIGAFSQAYGDGASMVQGVFQGLGQVITSMAESVGFKASLDFQKATESEGPPDPAKDDSPPPDDTQSDEDRLHADDDKDDEDKDKKKKEEDEDLSAKEKELCTELETLQTELSDQNITPERYTEILQRVGVIETELK